MAEKETFTEEILENEMDEAAEQLVSESESAQDTEDNAENIAEEQVDADDSDSNEKKKFFTKKKDKKDRQIDELKSKIDDLTDRVKRNMAEFDNYRKRTEKEKSAMFDMGAKSVIEKMLPIIDNFERGLAGVPQEQKDDAFVSGMDMVYKQMMTTLEGLGVEAIEAVGKPFDPNFHNAVMHVEDESLGENVVVQEFQKGYMYHGSVVRHSMVQVAN